MFSGVDSRTAFSQFLAIGGIFLTGLILAIFLATDSIAVFYFAIMVGWLFLLPYHSKIAVHLSVATFSAALILPYIPGRPLLWEFAALLGWSGLVVTIFMRQYEPNAPDTFRRHPWLYVGILAYCSALVFLMWQRGVGFRVLGSDQFGGRYYFQQLSCAIFPFLFTLVRLNEKQTIKLLVIQQLLASTYLVSDFVFSFAPRELFFLLQFFELSGDALSFEMQALQFGLRRYQSLYIVSIAGIWLLLYRYPLSFFLSRGVVVGLPILVGLMALGLLSGHRYLVMLASLTILFVAYAQRFYNARNMLITGTVGVLSLFLVYGFADSFPVTVQRALSVLPGIRIEAQAREDAQGTLSARKILRQIGWSMVPDYLWIGRGFGQTSTDYSMQWDPSAITSRVDQGTFYNGLVGLLVNTGLPGTLSMVLFLSSGTWIALGILRRIKRIGYTDMFANISCVLAGLWMANTIAFIFLHGDSEYALKTFALQAGLLIACDRNLRLREEIEVAPETETETQTSEPADGLLTAPAKA